MTKTRPSRRTNQRLIAAVLTVALVLLAVEATRADKTAHQTPTTALNNAYAKLALGQPNAYSDNSGTIEAVFVDLNAFSKAHNEARGQGWKLTSAVFDVTGNPVYTYTKTVGSTKLQLVLNQDISSLNDRKTDVHVSIVE